MNNFEKSILIVSHPDDECLFASSILDKISTLIICFKNIPKRKIISQGRDQALNSYPLKNIKVISLSITQSHESIIPINWLDVKDKFSGINGGYNNWSYNQNYVRLKKELTNHIPNNSKIFTHNPWGEYGHGEHCQVFKACFEIAKKKNSELFVSGYISNLSRFYALRKIHLLIPKIYAFKTNKKLFNLLRAHYLLNNCWTWFKNYKLPEIECFYEINLKINKDSSYPKNKYINVPLNYVENISPFMYFIKGFLKSFIPTFLKKILITHK